MSPNYPGVSAAYFGGPGSDRRVVVDQMPDLLPAGETLPDWASQGYQGLLQVGNQYLVAGFSKPPKDGAAFGYWSLSHSGPRFDTSSKKPASKLNKS